MSTGSSGLNPEAPEFRPGQAAQASTTAYSQHNTSFTEQSDDYFSEDHITEEELDEIEAAEEWVRTMAVVDMLEREHLIELALRYAPEERVEEIERSYGTSGFHSDSIAVE